MKQYCSVCPYDCPDACGLLVDVEGEKVVRVKGNPAHAFTRGTLCPKMAHYEKTVYSPRRILTPLKRTGAKGSGEFTPISWDEAIETIASRWKAIIADYGAEAIQPYSYAGTMGLIQHNAYHPLFHALGAANLARTICAPAKKEGWSAVYGSTRATAPQEAQKSDFIVLWSLDMLSTDIHFLHDVNAAKARGARVIAVDIYRHAAAKRVADTFIRVKPGTDGAFALGIMHVLNRDGLTDEPFLHEHVQGWEHLRDKILPKYTPERTAEITDVPADVIESFAHAYGKARAPFLRVGSGLSRRENGAMNCRLVFTLPALVGAFAKSGGGVLGSTSGSGAFDKKLVLRPDLQKYPVRTINMCEIGKELLQRKNPPIMSLFVYCSNPACTAPDQNAVTAGLRRGDLFTVVHERFMTDTAKYADIVLPATTSLEHNDLYYAYGHYTVGRGPAVISPVGESKSNWDVACLLAHAMGLKDPFFDQSEQDLVKTLIDKADGWPLPIDKEKLAAGDPVDLPLPNDYKMDFRTPSGKIEIENPRLSPKLPDYFAAEDDTGRVPARRVHRMRVFWTRRSTNVRTC